MRKAAVLRVVLLVVSVCLTLLVLEVAVRLHRGELFGSASRSTESGLGRMEFHPRLGWTSRPGRFGEAWTSNVDASGLRSNGRAFAADRPSILVVGDSFTFGDEVEDGETWPAQLEGILNKRVYNAGVGAYGIDQAFLRAELLLDQLKPGLVVLSFISDDINRTEFSHYPYGRGWKPYFKYVNGSLVLENVPVSDKPPPPSPRQFQTLHSALSYSSLADAILSRTAFQWWHNLPAIEQVHRDGENVSVELLVKLNQLTKERGVNFLAVALGTNGLIGDNARLPNVVRLARAKGVNVVDLSTDMASSHSPDQFRPGGHYSPSMNRAVAERIAVFLESGETSRSSKDASVE